MANDFSKEERVAFEELLEGFQDALVLSKAVNKYRTDQQMMERARDTIWRPQPYIMNSYDGMDQTGNFNDKTQLSVPATISFEKSVPWVMDARELRDALQEGRLGDGAKRKLASDINVAIMNVAAKQGSLVVPITTAATGFSDIAKADTIMNEQGVPFWDRYAALSSEDYNNMADNLAGREYLGTKKTADAYDNAYVGKIAGFESLKLDYANSIAAAAGGSITISTQDAATNYYVPAAITASPTTGERLNVDNRFQTVTVSATANVVAGDCFTIANVYAVHHETKNSTGKLKTFRVISVDSGTTMTITPPITSAQIASPSEAEIQYQNCTVTTKSATAAITWLNIAAARINPFWQKDCLEILPGRYAVPENSGVAIMRGTTDSGVELVMEKFHDIKTMKTLYRLDTLFGVVNLNPEMSGILLFGQTT